MNAIAHVLKRAVMLTAALVLAVPGFAQEAVSGFDAALGASFEASPNAVTVRPRPPRGLDAIRHWNRIAIDASGLDHTPVPAGTRASSASSSAPAAPPARWRSCTSRSSRR